MIYYKDKVEKLSRALEDSLAFSAAAKEAISAFEEADLDMQRKDYFQGRKENMHNATAKRKSMDLTRSLAKLRR